MAKPVKHDCFYAVNGIWGQGDPPPVAGFSSGPGIVLGSGACVWDDLYALRDLGAQYVSVAEAGCYVHLAGAFTQFKLTHFATLHPEFIAGYKVMVNPFQCQQILYHTNKHDPNADFAWNLVHTDFIGGTSSLFATLVALGLGFNPVVLCGVPLDNSPYFYSPAYHQQRNFEGCLRFWEKCLPIFDGRVKSMSGRTKELLGSP